MVPRLRMVYPGDESATFRVRGLEGFARKEVEPASSVWDAHLRLTPASVTRTLVVTTACIVAREEKVGT